MKKNAKFAKFLALAGFVNFMVLLSSYTPAHADFRICNKTSQMLGLALGYKDDQGWQSEGWWRIPPDQCEPIIKGDLASRFYYLYAEHASQTDTWGGNIYMCSSSSNFKITGVKDCYSRGFEKLGFFEVDTGDQDNWTVQFKDDVKLEPDSQKNDEASSEAPQ